MQSKVHFFCSFFFCFVLYFPLLISFPTFRSFGLFGSAIKGMFPSYYCLSVYFLLLASNFFSFFLSSGSSVLQQRYIWFFILFLFFFIFHFLLTLFHPFLYGLCFWSFLSCKFRPWSSLLSFLLHPHLLFSINFATDRNVFHFLVLFFFIFYSLFLLFFIDK